MNQLKSSGFLRRVGAVVVSISLAIMMFAPAKVLAAGDVSQVITFNPIANQLLTDNFYTVAATSDSGLTVSFTSDTIATCEVTGTEVTLKALGECTLIADQAGDSTYSAAASVYQTFEIVSGDNVITFAALDDRTWGESYEEVLAPASDNKTYEPNGFLIDVSSDSDNVVLTVDDTSVCDVVDNTSGYFLNVGECVITATDAGDAHHDAAVPVTQSFMIKRAAVELDARGLSFDAEVGDSVSVWDLFNLRTDFPGYVESANGGLPKYKIDASAGYYVPWLEDPESGLSECSDTDEGHSDGADYSPSVDMSHGGTCLVTVKVKNGSGWIGSEERMITVDVAQKARSINFNTETGYGVSHNDPSGPLEVTLNPYGWQHFHIRASASVGEDPVSFSTIQSRCTVLYQDDSVGIYIPDWAKVDSGNAPCRAKMTLAATQDYLAATPKYLNFMFQRAATKIVFDKITDKSVSAPHIDNYKRKRFNVNAYLRLLNGNPVQDPNGVAQPDRRARHVVSLTPTVCAAGQDMPDKGELDQTMGKMLQPGKCTLSAFSGSLNRFQSAPSVTRTFMITRLANAITFPLLSQHGVGDTLKFNTGDVGEIVVSATHLQVYLSESSAACSLTGNKQDGYTLTLDALGACKITATRPASNWVAAAKSVSRTFTVTKATGTMRIGVDLDGNGFFGRLDGGKRNNLGRGHDLNKTPHYNPTANKSYNIDHITNSSGVVTYSKVSGACVVNNALGKVTITGRDASGSCVVRASVPDTVGHTAAAENFTITVLKADATIGFFTNPGPVEIGTDVTLSATAPAGSAGVTFTADGSECSIVSGKLHGLSEGTCTVSAQILGNDAFNASATLSYDVSVSKATQSITFNPAAQRTYPQGSGASLNKLVVTATSTSGLTVAVTKVSGPCTVSGFTVTFTGVGNCILAANQVGNGTYSAATEVQRTIVVSKLPVATVAPTVSVPLLKYGQTVTRTQGDWADSGGTLVYATTWYRCNANSASTPTGATIPSGCSVIVGQTGPTYLTSITDLNKWIRVRVQVTNYSGTSYRWSMTTGKLLAP